MRRPVRCLAALLVTALLAPTASAESKRWNVILITADAMRGQVLPLNGNQEVTAPHLEGLAAESVNFTRAYTNITTTTPSHATLLSSLYPQDHKAYSNRSRISSEIVTLPEILHAHGWHTAAIVNFPWLNPETSNVPQGLDEIGRGDHVRKADKTNAWVMRFLDGRKKQPEKPFFLWIHYIDNHTPYHAPGKYNMMYYPKGRDPRAGKSGSLQQAWRLFPQEHRDDDYFKKWLRGITDVDYVVGTYKGSASWIDERVGELVARLKRDGIWDRTLFVFTSDHGESMGEHKLYFVHAGLFEVTARIPMIWHLPDGPRGKSVSELVDLADVMPTILTQLGLDVPQAARGQDFWPAVIEGQKSKGAVLLEHAGAQLEGVVTARYKYIRHRKTRGYYPGYKIKRGRIELYDLQADPGETRNIANKQPKIVKMMQGLLKKLRAGERTYQAGDAEIDEQTEELLRSMGYTQ